MLNFKNPSYETLADKEWLVTNGIGGYASSTISGANSRRYHGLLVASFNPPTDRRVLVSKVEENVIVNQNYISISTNSYPGVIHPQGYKMLESFERKPLPRATFNADDFKIVKTIFMVNGSNTTVIEYENEGGNPIRLELNPLFVYRDYHSTFHENDYFDFYTEKLEERRLKIFAHYGAEPFYMDFSKGNFQSQPAWFKNFEYDKEKARGLDFEEDAKSIGKIMVGLAAGEKAYLIFTTNPEILKQSPIELKNKELARLQNLEPEIKDEFLRDLTVAGNQFLVRRKSTNSYSLIAGYHWFTDWGRDTMIAMRGLTIAAGKQEESKSILRTFLKSLDRGMLPNRFPDQGEAPEYNTFDATMWLFVILFEYFEQFGDLEFIKEVFPSLTEILEAHINGTRYNIHATPEGLLFGGEGLVQLTWMDAKVGDYVVTPRQGCPVEINALWYNALEIYALFANEIGYSGKTYVDLAEKAKDSFRKFFINDKGYLNDVVLPDGYVDDSIRPNQIYAISLPFNLLTNQEAKSVLSIVDQYLYTDLGLRSLNTEHPDFKPTYGGDQWQRDTAYHQGTVWAFLWGEYALAYLKTHNYSAKARKEIQSRMAALKHHFYEDNCLHGISEIFDGLNPASGRGCVQQAWSVGMLMKVLLELQKSKTNVGSTAKKLENLPH